ncbi:hypothetical protein [Legionella sp.]|uniref:hypothetical protein n=1 Tax=Legionella sp. TaxID=459 RepID=UPI003C9EDF7E
MVWVYAGTDTIFSGHVNPEDLTSTQINPKTASIIEGMLPQADGSLIRLEHVTKSTQQQRSKMVWVYAGTGTIYSGHVNPEDLISTQINPKTGLITEGKLQQADGSLIPLEYINYNVRRRRLLYANAKKVSVPEQFSVSDSIQTIEQILFSQQEHYPADLVDKDTYKEIQEFFKQNTPPTTDLHNKRSESFDLQKSTQEDNVANPQNVTQNNYYKNKRSAPDFYSKGKGSSPTLFSENKKTESQVRKNQDEQITKRRKT